MGENKCKEKSKGLSNEYGQEKKCLKIGRKQWYARYSKKGTGN